MAMITTNRNDVIVQFHRVSNFRDLGGLQTQDGRRMKTGVLYRSDDPSKIAGHELDKFRQLNIKLVCDFRSPNERKNKLGLLAQVEDLRVVNIPIYQNDEDYTHLEFFALMMKNARVIDFEKMMRDFYYRIAFESNHQIKELITLIAEEQNSPALIHCTGGKDRTGFMSALIQLAAGIPRERVEEDYLLSNALFGPRMKKAGALIRWMSLFRISNDRLKPLLEVRREYLTEMLDTIMDKYGSIESYLTEACGVDRGSIIKLKDKLIE